MPQRHTILITGSGGMLGTNLGFELAGGFDIYGMDIARCTADSRLGYKECFEGDISDAGKTAGIVEKLCPEIIINTAAMTDVDGCERDKDKAGQINASGARNVALACKNSGAVMIHISTDFVFDGKKKAPYTEDDIAVPLNVYGATKLKGEEAIRDLLDEHYILRTSWLYGRYGKNFVDTILNKAKTEKVLKIVDDQVGSPTYTKDLAMAISALLDRFFSQYTIPNTQYGTYHVSNSGCVSWYDYAREILSLSGINTEVRPISSNDLNRPAKRPELSVLDNTKFTSLTGYKMRGWKEALREYIKTGRA